VTTTFGYIYDFRNPDQWRRPWPELYAETLDFIAWTEGLGFEGAWVPEHHLADDGYVPSPLTVLGAIAARTKRIKLGTAIALAPLYHPVRFAEDCAVLDILSNGRLEMAIAVGYRQRETDAFGVSFAGRGSRTDEFLEIVRRLWRGESVTFEGKHFSIKNARVMPPPPRGDIPLYIGGFSNKALQRAVVHGDGYHGNVDAYPQYAEKLRENGKDPATGRLRMIDMFFLVASDPEKAWHELGEHFYYLQQSYQQWQHEDRTDYDLNNVDVTLQPMSMEEFETSGWVHILTPGQAIDRLRDMLNRAPIEHFVMPVPPGFPLTKFRTYAELFAREVMPAFR
jgi:alkanesulfonate monooxygenase SsuD/methylene tetrahydromethanopterin reductase-like flavin-dependent oxidoreductase (luciferase family)